MDKVSAFRALHAADRILVLPNAWDAASAALFRSAGAAAIATSSAGLAWCCGYPDGDALPTEDLLFMVKAIARVCGDVPLTVDLESGYWDDPAAVAALVRDVVLAGASGINIEDRGADPALLVRKIAAIRASGVPVFVNARTDIYLFELASGAEAIAETNSRLQRYAGAGADGVFVPAVAEIDAIRAVATSVSLPLNILAVAGLPPLSDLFASGVRRVSAGATPARIAYGAAFDVVEELLTSNKLEPLFEGPRFDYGRMNALFPSG